MGVTAYAIPSGVFAGIKRGVGTGDGCLLRVWGVSRYFSHAECERDR